MAPPPTVVPIVFFAVAVVVCILEFITICSLREQLSSCKLPDIISSIQSSPQFLQDCPKVNGNYV